jgi:hypothetical protein
MDNQWELVVIAVLVGLAVIITIGFNRWRRGFADPPPRPPG